MPSAGRVIAVMALPRESWSATWSSATPVTWRKSATVPSEARARTATVPGVTKAKPMAPAESEGLLASMDGATGVRPVMMGPFPAPKWTAGLNWMSKWAPTAMAAGTSLVWKSVLPHAASTLLSLQT